MKICIVCSPGGHLAEARLFKKIYSRYEHYYVLNDRIEIPNDMKENTIFIRHAERDWRVLINIFEAWSILKTTRPDVIFSTGAGPAVPFAIIGKLMRCKIVFVETVTRVNKPSLTAKIIYLFADKFYVQWEPLLRYFPKAKLRRGLI